MFSIMDRFDGGCIMAVFNNEGLHHVRARVAFLVQIANVRRSPNTTS